MKWDIQTEVSVANIDQIQEHKWTWPDCVRCCSLFQILQQEFSLCELWTLSVVPRQTEWHRPTVLLVFTSVMQSNEKLEITLLSNQSNKAIKSSSVIKWSPSMKVWFKGNPWTPWNISSFILDRVNGLFIYVYIITYTYIDKICLELLLMLFIYLILEQEFYSFYIQ